MPNLKKLSEFSKLWADKFLKSQISRELIELILESKSNLGIIPVQDVLGFGSEARMNHSATGNKRFEELSKMTESSRKS